MQDEIREVFPENPEPFQPRIADAACKITGRKPAGRALPDREEEVNAAHQEIRQNSRYTYDFLAILSHELRNPLASIQSSLGILKRATPGGEQAQRAMAIIDRQFNQLTHLVDDLLDVTRIAQNKIRLQRERLELNELIRRTVEDHQALFERNGVRLETVYDRSAIFVNADSARLAQVVGNLLINAAKFTRRGGSARVAVAHDPLAKQAIVRVADTGEGIPAEMLPRLFQPFSQAEATLDRTRGGLGMGLALAKGLVELHGGTIAVNSAGVGRGAEFIVHLPLDEAATLERREVRQERPHRNRRVLIVEDNADLAGSLCELLELDGHVVEVAYSGSEGLVKACEFQPDILLCDIGLPGMDGYAVARAMRADDTFKDVFLVALTGYALPEDLERAAAAGFDRHLAKPPDLVTLERMLGELP